MRDRKWGEMAPVVCPSRYEAWPDEIAAPAKAGGFAEIEEEIDGSDLPGEQTAASVSPYDAEVSARWRAEVRSAALELHMAPVRTALEDAQPACSDNLSGLEALDRSREGDDCGGPHEDDSRREQWHTSPSRPTQTKAP